MARVSLARRQELYRLTHGGAPPPLALRELDAGDPRDGATEMGALVEIVYQTIKLNGAAPGELANHRHAFKHPLPVLAFTASDSRLLILGGGYRLTPRGIEG